MHSSKPKEIGKKKMKKSDNLIVFYRQPTLVFISVSPLVTVKGLHHTNWNGCEYSSSYVWMKR